MVFVEVCAEVFAQVFAEGGFDEAQVFGHAAAWEGGREKGAAAGHDVVFKPLAIEHRNDAVGIWREAELVQGLAHFLQKLRQGVAGVGEDQPGMVEAVAAHHAADGIGKEGGHVFPDISAREGDLVFWYFGLQLIFKAVGGNEEAVVLGFQLLHPADGGGALRFPVAPARFQRQCLQLRPQQRLVAEVPRGLEVVPVGAR